MNAFEFRAPPDVTEDFRARGTTQPRFEDICQDGRLRLQSAWAPMGPLLWNGELTGALPLFVAGREDGVRAVLTRVFLEGGETPVSLASPLRSEIRVQFAHAEDREGQTSHLLFNTWLDSRSPSGNAIEPMMRGQGEPCLVARAWGQHVITRPMAAPGQHRVTSLPVGGQRYVPELVDHYYAAQELLVVPEGAELLDAEPRWVQTFAFGLTHTDPNQHVNFLVYPRIVEDLALARFAELGHARGGLARWMEVGYRKPCFVGDSVGIVLQAFRWQGRLGAVAAFLPSLAAEQGFGDGRALHCAVRVLFAP